MCPGATLTLTPVSAHIDTWLWSDGSNGSTYEVGAPGTVIITGSNQCGSVSDTMTVLAGPEVPQLDLGGGIELCPNESEALIIDIPDVEILWHDTSSGSAYLVTTGGLVYAMISNACGSSSDTISVTMLNAIPDLDLGNNQSLCPGETITIDPCIPDVDYLWHDGSMDSRFIANLPGMVILTISNACGVSTDTIEIIEDLNGPEVDLGPDILGCEGDTIVLDAGISGVDYLWQDSSVAARFITTQSGTYHVQVSNACGMDADTVIVDIHGTEPMPSLGPDTTLCEGEVLILISDADAETMIEWLNLTTGTASTGSATTVDEGGTYILSETNHCGTASDTIVIDFESAPAAFDLGEDMVICPGDTVTLYSPQTTGVILWETPGGASTGSQHLATLAGSVMLSISNDCGIATDEIMIAFDPNEPVVVLDPLSLCEGESVVLDVTQPFDADYLWNTGSTSSVLQVVTAGDFHVSVMTDCYLAEGSVEVTESEDCGTGIYIPNVFSPNFDQINDFWEVLIDPSIDVRSLECSIYDRWGNALFRTISIPVKWDGTFQGEMMLPGVYVYVMVLESENGIKQIATGDLTLMR